MWFLLEHDAYSHISSVAEVTITIKNQGEEAYKLNEYGKSIVITRRFTKDGTSTWKIKSKDGRVISTKREELSAICDNMNIQVDNPLNVLTQGDTFKISTYRTLQLCQMLHVNSWARLIRPTSTKCVQDPIYVAVAL